MDNGGLIAQNECPKSNRFDESAGAVDDSDVADRDLILQDQENPADEVLHEILRAESYRQSNDAGAGKDWADINADLFQGR